MSWMLVAFFVLSGEVFGPPILMCSINSCEVFEDKEDCIKVAAALTVPTVVAFSCRPVKKTKI